MSKPILLQEIDTLSELTAETAKQVDLDITDARINLIVAPPATTDNIETTDIRVGADGTTYASAGDAVRSQVSDKLGKNLRNTVNGTDIELSDCINGDIILHNWIKNLAQGAIKGVDRLTVALTAGTYTLSFDGVIGKTVWNLYARLKDINGTVILTGGHLVSLSSVYDLSQFSSGSGYYYGGTRSTKIYTFTIDADYTVDFMFSGNSDTVENISINTMLEKSNTKTVYVPYTGYTITATNADTTLTNSVNVINSDNTKTGLFSYGTGTTITNEYNAPIELSYPVVSYEDILRNMVGDNVKLDVVYDVNGEFHHSSNEDMYVEITKIVHNTLSCYGVKDGVRYRLPITSVATGSSAFNIAYTGIYHINRMGFSDFVITCDRIEFDCVTSIISHEPKILAEQMPRSSSVVSTPTTELIQITGMTIWGIRNGKYIGSRVVAGVLTIYEIDRDTFAETQKSTIVPSGSAQPLQCEILEDGTVLFILSYGYSAVVRSVDLITWTIVHSLKDNAYIYGSFRQLDSFKNNVIMSEYKIPVNYMNTEDATGRKLYLSTDSGITFYTIFDLTDYQPEFAGTHIHSIAFDRWNENIIWVVTGDGDNHKMIYYSLDIGLNWYQAGEFNDVNLQMTSIIPLKNCVLFGSDCPVVGMARFNRPVNGIVAGQKLDFDMPFFVEPNYEGTVPVASRPYINYKNSTAFFGFTISTPSSQGHLNNGQVYATNGYDFKEVYKSGSSVSIGVPAIYGDKERNKVIAKQGLSEKFVVIDSDIFN